MTAPSSDEERPATVDVYGPKVDVPRRAIIIAPIEPADAFSLFDSHCGASGTTEGGVFMLCTRTAAHEGNHWDAFDGVYFKVEVGL